MEPLEQVAIPSIKSIRIPRDKKTEHKLNTGHKIKKEEINLLMPQMRQQL